MMRTIGEMNRTILAASGLSEHFWDEATATSVSIRNIAPTRSLRSVTPYQALTNQKPDLGYLCPFRCLAYTFIHKDQRKSRKWQL